MSTTVGDAAGGPDGPLTPEFPSLVAVARTVRPVGVSREVLLVRHPPVPAAFRGVCYGSSDVPAGDARAVAAALEAVLAGGPVEHLYTSGLARCAGLAAAVAARAGVAAVADARLRERDFGAWELRTWDAIHAETGDAMMGMVRDPAGWRPPGGETTFGLRDRVLAWHAALPAAGRVVAVTHGGPIAALVGTRLGLPVARWPGLVPACGGVVRVPG